MLKIGTEVLAGLTWYIIDQVNPDSYIGIDQEGGELEFTYEQITHVYV